MGYSGGGVTDKLRGGLIGLLVGDALGVPYEFTRSYEIPGYDQIEMVPPDGFLPAHAVPPGTWSDDGSQALCLLSSLQERGGLDTSDLACKILAWESQGYMAVGGRVFDIGIQTKQALRRLQNGCAPEQAGGCGEADNGNGSLMRVLPLALWHRGSDAQLVEDAMRQSSITHGHDRSKVACALYCMWARLLLQEAGDLSEAVSRTMPHLTPGQLVELVRLHTHQPTGYEWGSGYVLDTFATVREALKESSYEAVVRKAISFGRDTDTTACIAGGLAGIVYGEQGIPLRWRQTLRGQELLIPLWDNLSVNP